MLILTAMFPFRPHNTVVLISVMCWANTLYRTFYYLETLIDFLYINCSMFVKVNILDHRKRSTAAMVSTYFQNGNLKVRLWGGEGCLRVLNQEYWACV